MMEKKCRYKRTDVWIYVQNRMSREEEAEFQLHLLHCDQCRDELARLRRMVRSMEEKERRKITLKTWIMAASITCVIVGGGAYWYQWSVNNGSGEHSSGDMQDMNIKPPVLRNGVDSVVHQDTIPDDTTQIFIEDFGED